MSKFPCTTKQDLRDNYPFDTFAVPMEQVVRIHASSGTTGKPTVVGYTQNDIDNWANIVPVLRAAAAAQKIKFMSPTATACLPAVWARTTARSV
jgi:phenylacetate-CoA ligase